MIIWVTFMMVSTRRLAETAWKAFSCPFEESHRALALSTLLSPPGDRWRGVLGFVPDGSRDWRSRYQGFRSISRALVTPAGQGSAHIHTLRFFGTEGGRSVGLNRTIRHASLGLIFIPSVSCGWWWHMQSVSLRGDPMGNMIMWLLLRPPLSNWWSRPAALSSLMVVAPPPPCQTHKFKN